MTTTSAKLSSDEIERKVSGVVAGHKMAGFEIADADRDMVRRVLRGERTADEVVTEIKARNATAGNVDR